MLAACAVAVVCAAAGGPALAGAPNDPNAPKADEKKKSDHEGFWSGLPLLKDEAIAAGADLPLPFGAALVMTGLKGRDIGVTDVRIGLTNAPRSVSQFLNLGSTSDVVNANLKLDVWPLPFLNLYTLLGYVHNDSTSHVQVTVPLPGPIPGDRVVRTTIPTELDGFLGGLGATLGGGWRDYFLVLDCNYDTVDLGFDSPFHALIASARAGWNGRIREMPVQFWAGAGYWDTAATAKGHADIAGVGRLVFEADQRPLKYWVYDLGGQFEFNKHFLVFLDVGTDFAGGYVFAAGPTLRF